MARVFGILVFLILLISALALACWWGRATVAAYLIQRNLGAPVSIESLELTPTNASFSRLWIGNPSGFKDPTAFTAGSIEVDATYTQIMGDPLTIDRILMSDLNIYLENGKNGDTNWSKILEHSGSKSSSNKHYLIKTLTLKNLTVQVIQPNGQIKRYPTIASMEFYNISDQTGFPINEIEKAIFNQVLKNLYQQLDLQNTLKQIIPKGTYIPNIPFFN